MTRILGEPAQSRSMPLPCCLRRKRLPASADDSSYVARQVWPSRSPGFSIDQWCRSSLRWRVFECEVSRSLHLPSRQLASWLGSVCARGGLGQRPRDQCWWRQARACRRLCVLSAWCLCASEERGTRVGGIYIYIYIYREAFLGIASLFGSWRLSARLGANAASWSSGNRHSQRVHALRLRCRACAMALQDARRAWRRA